jgi:coproporphyrinogen III oxidase
MNYDVSIASVKDYFLQLQARLCLALEEEDDKGRFHEDHWQRAEGGGGKTRVLLKGQLIEQGAVNFSHIFGMNLPASATLQRPQWQATPFQALGLSLIIHPLNPYVPTVHMNLRFILLKATGEADPLWWFGGGFDLTPYYPFLEDCQHWHQMAKAACDPFGTDLYAQYKKNCDEYFYLKHRNEARGIGGIFFDDLNQWDFQTNFQFIQSIGDHFLLAYLPIVQRRKHLSYGKRERDFQCYRRSRYVEFNLIYDRGTLFGLQSGGRIESILSAMPPQANWYYNWQAESGSPEAALTEKFLLAQEWV